MPLKIVHHKESQIDAKKNKLSLNFEKTIANMFAFCESVMDISNMVVEVAKKSNQTLNVVDSEKEKNERVSGGFDCEESSFCAEDDENFENKKLTEVMSLFSLIAGKKTSPLEAVSKTTSVIQKINILADGLGISLSDNVDEETDVLTDEDIDVMVQMVKDFGEKQIREDAKECCKKAAIQQSLEEKKKTNAIDVYDVYHED